MPRWQRLWHPWGWLLILLAVLTAVPDVDLRVSGAFHDPAQGFAPWQTGFGEFVRRVLPRLIIGSAVVCGGLWLVGLARKQTVAAMTTPRLAFLVSTLIVGPGLIVETLLKPNWGRARPDEIVPFGGTFAYTPPLWFADACERNCSFASGHAAVAFWVTAYAFLLPPRYYRLGMALGLLFGAGVGLVRVMQGAHFISDVIYAGAIVVAVNAIAARVILKRP